MSLTLFEGWGWLLACLLPFLFIQRRVHREIQAVLLLITRSPGLSVGVFSFLFFPGVFLHELSHFIMAKILRVRTGRFSLIPGTLPDGSLRLGFVETAQADFLRDALIGAAPLIAGGLVTAWIGIGKLGAAELIAPLADGNVAAFFILLSKLPQHPDFWLWFYLAFTISSTMLPSPSDRKGWAPVIIVILVLVGILLLAGAGTWLLENAAPRLNEALKSIAMVFGISLGMHLMLLIPLWLLRKLISKITGLKVE